MAEDIIKIDPETVQVRVAEYRTQAKNMNEIIAQMDRLLALLGDEWIGHSSRAFSKRYKDIRPGFKNAETLIQDIAEALEKTGMNFASVDDTMASQFQF